MWLLLLQLQVQDRCWMRSMPHTNTCIHACTHAHTHMCAQTHACSHKHMHMHMYAYMHSHIHTCTCMFTCTHAHMYTYTHGFNLWKTSCGNWTSLPVELGNGLFLNLWWFKWQLSPIGSSIWHLVLSDTVWGDYRMFMRQTLDGQSLSLWYLWDCLCSAFQFAVSASCTDEMWLSTTATGKG